MYSNSEEYLEAFRETFDLNKGDNVIVARLPVPEDGLMHLGYWNTRLWTKGYHNIEEYKNYLGKSFTIYNIDSDGMIHLAGTNYRFPFFVLEGYDHLNPSLKHISKSKYLEWDKRVSV